MRMQRALALAPAVCLLATASAALAQARPPIVPKLGKWEMTRDLGPDEAASMAGMPPQVMQRRGYDPARQTITTIVCLNVEASEKLQEEEKRLLSSGAKCDQPVYTSSGDAMGLTVKCTAPRYITMHVGYHFNAARDAYTYESKVTVTVSGKAETRSTRGTARRIGDC